MLEKPKRPTKIPNQDNKQPQTINELIRRYDLDNTKVYDFLENLVTNLNTINDATQEDILRSEKLIYSKKTTEEDSNGFEVTDIKLEDGKQYKIVVDGGLTDVAGVGGAGVLRLVPLGSDSSVIRNTILIGQNDESTRHYFSTTENIKLIRSYGTYGAVCETFLSYKNRIVKAMTNAVGLGQTIGTSVNSRSGTMLGYYNGDITTLKFDASDGFTIIPGTIIKIFKLP